MIKILLVEDDFGVRDNLKDFLEFFFDDLEIEQAINGIEGIKRVEETRYNILITDQMMPDMKGSEFISTIIEKLRRDNTWIYIYSGQLMNELHSELKGFEEVRVIDKLTNPIFFKELVEEYRSSQVVINPGT
ncbi:MAG: response regulator transcription factor [Roseivirga sp.]|nr:response regulator transcription factor [Roseivirga sp.]